ncbi:MAG: hypothetical protein AMXMBFR76_25470 [Pseudomonadota bacterium]
MYSAEEIARRRLVEFIALEKGRGEIWAAGTIQRVTFDDLLDLVQAVEMVMLKLTGKVLNPKLRPRIASRAGLACDVLLAGGAELYDGSQGDAPQGVGHWYLRVEIDGSRWDVWFARLDELIKCLYAIVREAQADQFIPQIAVTVPGVAGHA